MREIKFRAWAGGVMVNFGLFDTTAQVDAKRGVPQFRRRKAPQCTVAATSPVMQYTGLKDKNGVEIYEGDLIRNSNHEFRNIVEIIPCFAGWGALLRVDWFGKPIPKAERIYYLLQERTEWLDGNHEVTGNIYENPELI